MKFAVALFLYLSLQLCVCLDFHLTWIFISRQTVSVCSNVFYVKVTQPYTYTCTHSILIHTLTLTYTHACMMIILLTQRLCFCFAEYTRWILPVILYTYRFAEYIWQKHSTIEERIEHAIEWNGKGKGDMHMCAIPFLSFCLQFLAKSQTQMRVLIAFILFVRSFMCVCLIASNS